MDDKKKTRLIGVAGAIVIVVVIALFALSTNVIPRTVLVSEAPEFTDGQRIMVVGTVVDDSVSLEDGVLTFKICDPANDPSRTITLTIRYEGEVPQAFDYGVRVRCYGNMDGPDVLACTELIAK